MQKSHGKTEKNARNLLFVDDGAEEERVRYAERKGLWLPYF